jgi:AcrR family transcriptional regulator
MINVISAYFVTMPGLTPTSIAIDMPTTYHHGNLRNALLEEAMRIVERDGPEAVSLRELAAAAGVSAAAPYKHFADRSAVLAAIALKGYQDMEEQLRKFASARSSRKNLREALLSFVQFADERPGLFQLMYVPPRGLELSAPEVKAAELKCYESFLGLVERYYASLQEEALRVRVVALWSALLGYAVTRLRHPLQAQMRPRLTDAQLTAAVLDAAIGTA